METEEYIFKGITQICIADCAALPKKLRNKQEKSIEHPVFQCLLSPRATILELAAFITPTD